MTDIKLVIFDMDKTLFNETLYADVIPILDILKSLNIKMAIASHNIYSEWLCDRYGITKYFDVIKAYYHNGKNKHIKQIMRFYNDAGANIEPNSVLFFDDKVYNTNMAKSIGINCILVNPEYGIQLAQINSIFLK